MSSVMSWGMKGKQVFVTVIYSGSLLSFSRHYSILLRLTFKIADNGRSGLGKTMELLILVEGKPMFLPLKKVRTREHTFLLHWLYFTFLTILMLYRGCGRNCSFGIYCWTPSPLLEWCVGCVDKKAVSTYPLQAGIVQLLLHFTSLPAFQ